MPSDSPTHTSPFDRALEISDWAERCAMNLQNAAASDKPGAYRGAHPCECMAFAADLRERIEKAIADWHPISDPPPTTSSASVRVIGIMATGLHVFAQYTPFYLGHEDEAKMLWIAEGFPWAYKPTHWMPLPEKPHGWPRTWVVVRLWNASRV